MPDTPTFLLLGAARCATTSLHNYLQEHPDVQLSDIKEINYFSNERFFGKGWPWYTSHFARLRGGAIGESSTSYTAAVADDDKVPRRIAEALPGLRFVYLVRDPVERLLSHYRHYQHRGERIAPMAGIASDPRFEDTRWQGRYHHQLTLFRRHFPADAFLVTTVGELNADPAGVMRRVFRHIGADPQRWVADGAPKRIHNSGERSTRKTAFGHKVLSFYTRHLEQRRLPYKLKASVRLLSEIGARPLDQEPLPAEDRARLLAFYAEDTQALARDYGTAVDSWPTFRAAQDG